MERSFGETTFFSPDQKDIRENADRLFYEKEYITKEELETFVDGLETRIREQMEEVQTESSRLSLILHVFTEEILRMETIEKEFPDYRVRTQALGENHFSMRYKPTTPITKEGEVIDQSLYEPVHISKNDPEILQALRQLRLSVLESLKHRFREEQWEDRLMIHAIAHVIKKDAVYEVEEEKILKIHPEWMERYMNDNHRALQELYALRDSGWESRHIAYELIEKEIHLIEGKRRGMEVYKKIDMTTLDKLLNTTPPPPLKETLGYVLDTLHGAAFLWDNNLTLTDNTIENVGIDRETGHGILFDFGALLPKGSPLKGFISKPEYIPPEFLEGGIESISDRQMVYEFGICLSEVLDFYIEEDLPEEDGRLMMETSALVHDMILPSPSQRPSLREAINRMESFGMGRMNQE